MGTLEAGSEFLGMTLRGAIAAEPWGTIWRATHPEHGPVIAILYTGPDGPPIAEYPLAQREVWNLHAEAGEPFAPILFAGYMGFADGREAPYLLCRDPGGPTLAEAHEGKPMEPAEAARMVADLAKSLGALSTDGCGPWGIAPAYCVRSAEGRWILLPVCRVTAPTPAAARFLPPEAARDPNPSALNPDVYALALLWAGVVLGRPTNPPAAAEVRTAIPLSRLALLISNNLVPQRGRYAEHRLVHLAAERYAKHDAAEDLAEANEARAAATRHPILQKLHENRAILRRLGTAAAVVLGLVLGVFLLKALFTTRNTDRTPRGLSNLYFEAIVKRRPATAGEFEIEAATGSAVNILRYTEAMHRDGRASRVSGATSPQMRADTNPVQARTTLVGEGGEPILIVEYVMRRRDDGTWRITSVLFAEPGAPEEEMDDGR